MVTCGSVLLGPAGDASGCTAHVDSGRANVYEQTPAIVSNATHAIRRFIGCSSSHTNFQLKVSGRGVLRPGSNEVGFYSAPRIARNQTGLAVQAVRVLHRP